MGNGYRNGDVLNFQITANYDMTAVDQALWERAFAKASELLWNATEGQLRFGSIFVTESLNGVNNAEFVLTPVLGGRALGTFGGFGQIGRAVQLPAYVQSQVLTVIHELGHHLWTLGEEYARAEGAVIDQAATLPVGHNNRIIPLVATNLAEPDANYAGADAVLVFNGTVETQQIVSKVGNRITVAGSFTQSPQSTGSLTVQWTNGVECTGDPGTGACIMEFSRSSAGLLAADGTWTPAAKPVTEYCTTANHDPDKDTAQERSHAEACWETIVDRSGYSDLAGGGPAATTPASTTAPTGWVAPTWTVLEPHARLALVLDSSGSMNRNGGARLAGVRTGARFWIDNAAVEDDELTIIWYSTAAATQLALSDFGSLTPAQLTTERNSIASHAANGGTNILSGLTSALTELTGPATPASLQATVLITDGAHNTPAGTAMSDAIPAYRAANTNIFTLGVGTGAEMDLAGLAALATATSGASRTAGDGADSNAIQDALIEINAMVRGGLISSSGTSPDTRRAEDSLSRLTEEAAHILPSNRPPLDELAERYGMNPWQKVLAGSADPHRLTFFGIDLESDVRATTFTLSHDPAAVFWMYLIDPDGREVRAADGDVVAWQSSTAYEFAKLVAPRPGNWTLVAVRIDDGAPVHLRSIWAVNHPELVVYAHADRVAGDGPVRISAGARYLEPITRLSAVATVRSTTGTTATVVLDDHDVEGVFEGWAALPDGLYEGYVELRGGADQRVAGLDHAILHADDLQDVLMSLPPVSPFVRHVPISFAVGPVRVPQGFPRDERPRRVRPHREPKAPRERAPRAE